VTALIDYEQFCGVTPAQATGPVLPADQKTTVVDLKADLDSGSGVFVLDVREPHEYDICRIPGSTLIPLGELDKRIAEVPADGRPVVVHCKSGARSAKAVTLLRAQGHSTAVNLEGGILEWIRTVDPSQPAY